MKNFLYKILLSIFVLTQSKFLAQLGVGPAPYCFPLYGQIPCNQPGPSNTAGNFINDFINSFSTAGAVVNITNNNSGCNAQTFVGVGIRNYFFFGCSQYLVVNPGQNITCTFQSGNVYSQGFTCFVDWNQDGVYNPVTERVCSIPGVPAAASFNSASFVVPLTQANGIYRMRVRCAFATIGSTIDPCMNYGFGETEEYNVYVNTTPPGVITATASAVSQSLCSGQSISLTALSSAAASVALTYSWSGPGSFTSNVQSPVIANASSTNSGVYSVTVSPGSCPAISTIAVNVIDYPSYTLTPLTTTVCQGGIITPSVSFGVVLPGTPCSTVGVGPACANPAIISIGNGASTNASFIYPSPYAKWWNDAHQQFLYRASELTSMGLSQGYITSLAFNVTNVNGAGNFPGYTIKIKCTANTQANAFDMVGLTQVFTGAVTPVVGWNTHNFVTPYYWDGVSNLLVDICFNNVPWATNVSSPYTTTAFTSCIYNYATVTGVSSCGTTVSLGTSSNRPNTRFGNCGTINPNSYTYLWSPGPGIAAPTASTTAITTQPISGSLSAVVYSVAVTPITYSCPNVQTLTVTIINALSPTITPTQPLCNTSGTLSIIANPAGGTFSNNPAISVTGVITPSLAALGTSTVLYSVGVGSCIATGTTDISVSQFNTSNITGTIAPLCITSPTQNLMSIVQSTVNGNWTGIGVTSNIFDPLASGPGTFVLSYNTTSSPNPTVCPGSSSIVVSVTNTFVPNITPLNPMCNITPSVTIIANPGGGNWYGNSGVSSLGILTPSLAPIGTSIVNYSVNVGPCVVTNSTTIDISQYNTAAITGTISEMCHTFPAANLLSIVQNTFTGLWSGINVVNNSFNPNLPTGIYTLTYNTTSTPNPTLCPDTQTINVSVLNPIQPTITAVAPMCNTAPYVQLTVTPTTGTWTTSPYNVFGTFIPNVAAIGNNTVQYVIGTNTCNIQDTKTISVEAFVPAQITGNLTNLCITSSPVNLNTITSNNLGTWSGVGVNNSSFDPSVSGGGSFILSYNTASYPSSLCPAQATIAVNVFSLSLPSITKVGTYCNSAEPFQLQSTPVGGVFGGVNNNAVTPLGLFYPAFATIGDNIINYSVTSGPCVAVAHTTINIEKFISADLSQYAGPFCKNDVGFNLNSIVQNIGGIWSGPGINSNFFTPANANIGNNNFLIYSTHSMPTASLCPDTSAIRIQVNDVPVVSIISSKKEGCAPIEIVFNCPSANTGTGYWNFGDGTEGQVGLTLTHVYNKPGSYAVSFNYLDDIGCSANAVLPNNIDVYEVPKAAYVYTPTEITIANPDVQFSNTSTVLGNNIYQWQIGDLYQTSEVNPRFIFPKVGDYEVTLTATTDKGCQDATSKIVQVRNEFGIYIPAIFTPNGDNLNDVFLPVMSPYGFDLKTFNMEIFDRWGELLFSTKDANVGWDGTRKNKNSEPVKEDVYIYKIKFKDSDGKIYNKTGHITLMK